MKDEVFERIYTEAHKAGLAALKACTPTPMVVAQHQNVLNDSSPIVKQWYVPSGVCGFAWINVKPGTSKFARWAKTKKVARKDSYYGGVTFWVGEGGQSYELKMAYARAFADILYNHGINAFANGRLD